VSEYDEQMSGMVRERIDWIEAEWIAGRLDAESMESLLLYARAGAEIALAAKKISETSKELVTEMEVKVFRTELELAEKDQTLKETMSTFADKVSDRITPINDVLAERDKQDIKWGEQNHPNGTGPTRMLLGTRDLNVICTFKDMSDTLRDWTDDRAKMGILSFADILLEEVFEALAEEDPAKLREELVQVAAVAVQWVEAIDRAQVRNA
jgi:hypothetical protein